jgi:transcriptional regulator with XRE-family HTH domain
MLFAPLPSTTEDQYFQGVWSRMFGAFMESAREKAGLSVEQAAVLTGMGPEQWSAMEAGAWLPATRQQLHVLAAALDIEWTTMVSIVQMCSQAWGIQ